MYKATDIARFVRTHLQQALPELSAHYKRRDILRMRGHLVQWLFVGVSRGGWIHVNPTFYVLGPEIYKGDLHKLDDGSVERDALFHSTVSLAVKFPRRWSFEPETSLDEYLAQEILARLHKDSPINFTQPLSDETIDQGLRWFGKEGLHWSADLFLAFFNMTRGAPTARKDLARAFELFRRNSRLSTDKPLRDWEEVLLARFEELEARLDHPDCIALCRADAEAHAQLLKLPPIVWPSEWPTSVSPWSKESGLTNHIGRFFGIR